MKKVLSVILILLLLLSINFDTLWFCAMQFSIKKSVKIEIKKGIKESELSVITISLKDNHRLRWIKPDREFRYQGEMYDVVKVKVKNGKKYIYCLNDIKEKQLINNFIKKNKSDKKARRNIKRSNLIIKYINYSNSFLVNLNINDFVNKSWQFIYNSNIVQTSSPPPKLV